MNKVAILAVLAGCIAAAAAVPASCQSPKQWYGQVFAFEASRADRGEVEGDYFYDETNLRKARYERAHYNQTEKKLHIIEDYRAQKYYEIDLDTNDCTSGDLQHPFIPHGVVRNGTFRGDFIIGSTAIEGAGVEVELWTHEFVNDQGVKYFWTGQFTRFACIPIRTQVQSEDGFYFSESFVDVVGGIPDPNAFIVPPQCQ